MEEPVIIKEGAIERKTKKRIGLSVSNIILILIIILLLGYMMIITLNKKNSNENNSEPPCAKSTWHP